LRTKLLLHLQSLLDEKLPFLALKKGGQGEVIVVSQNNQKRHEIAPDNMAYAVFSKFQNNENQIFISGDRKLSFKWVVKDVIYSNQSKLVEEDGKKEYFKLFEKAKNELENNGLQKVILSRKQELLKKDNDLDIFERLLDNYPTANGYFFYHPQVGKWMGATPELLLEVNDEKISTMSLAGTAINNGIHSHIWGEKEKEEQRLVTDFIKSKFNKVGVTEVKISDVKTIKAGHLLHLQTVLSGTIKKEQLNSVLNSLHPTPAVCGLPRDQAMAFISNEENYDRSFYTGYLGIVEGHNRDYFVNLRCMQLLDKTVIIYIGGGVTAKSNVELEYQETIAKLKTMYKLL